MSDPLVQALVDKLPDVGTRWPAKDRATWLSILDQCFDLIYVDGDEAPVKAIEHVAGEVSIERPMRSETVEREAPPPPPDQAPPQHPKIEPEPSGPTTMREVYRSRFEAPEWTEEELESIRRVIRTGGSARDAERLIEGRTKSAVHTRYYNLKKAMKAGGTLDSPSKPPEPKPDPEPVPCEAQVTEQAKPFSNEALPYSDKAIIARLRHLGHVEPWTPALDVELVDLLLTGTKSGAAAEILEISKDDVVARFKRLCPDTNPDAQRQVLRILKANAKAHEVAE